MIISIYYTKIKKIKNKINNLKKITQYNIKKKRISRINQILQKSKKKKNRFFFKHIAQESKKNYYIVKKINDIEKIIQDNQKLLQLSLDYKDNSILHDIKLTFNKIEKKIKKINYHNLFKEKHDNCNCYLDIQSGSGGIDAQDWSNMLLRMYLKWLEKKKFKTRILHKLNGEIAGIKSATIHVIGPYAFGWLKTETGIHRLIRKSPFNSGGRRHTSFSSAFIYPEINKEINIKIDYSELRIDVFRSSGSGGQHVNRTESAVRITHLPTSIVTQCQNERSQHKNKEQALKQMKLKLYNLELKKKNIEKENIENSKSSIRWGNQIRSYILDQSRIKDNRTGIETREVQSVLDGNLDLFIETSLKKGL
ncbi:peptide chain release factor 2 [Buchnera aphidicola (Shivaphis celti)]